MLDTVQAQVHRVGMATEMPSHNHGVSTKNEPGSLTNMTDVPTAGYFVTRFVYNVNGSANAWFKPASGSAPTPTTLHPTTVSPTGGGLAHNNLQPLLALNWCIAVRGIFPSRN